MSERAESHASRWGVSSKGVTATIDAAFEAERAAILVHLSNMAANWNGAVGTAAVEMAVRQIERGDHLPGGGE